MSEMESEKQEDFAARVRAEAKKLVLVDEQRKEDTEKGARARAEVDKETAELRAKVLLLEQQLEARGQPQPCKSTVQQHTNSSEPGHHQARQENALHEDREPQRKNVPHCITPSPGQPHRNARGSDETRNMTESFRDLVGATRGMNAPLTVNMPGAFDGAHVYFGSTNPPRSNPPRMALEYGHQASPPFRQQVGGHVPFHLGPSSLQRQHHYHDCASLFPPENYF